MSLRYRLVTLPVPKAPKVPVSNTNRYLRLIHKRFIFIPVLLGWTFGVFSSSDKRFHHFKDGKCFCGDCW